MRYTDQVTGHGTQAVPITSLVDGPLAYDTGKYVKSGASGWTWDTPVAASDGKVLISVDDTSSDYVEGKTVAGAGIRLNVLNPGGDETLEVECTVVGGATSLDEAYNGGRTINVDAGAVILESPTVGGTDEVFKVTRDAGSVWTFYANAQATSPLGLILNSGQAGAGVNDFQVKSDSYANMFNVSTQHDTVQVGTATAGAIAALSNTGVVLNEDSQDRDFRIESNAYENMFIVDGGADQVQVGTATVGAIATFDNTGVILNEDSTDRDFRVESDAAANMLLVDGGADCVGIDESAPDTNVSLHVGSDTNGKGIRIDHPPRAKMYLNAAQTNLVKATWTKVLLETDEYDSDTITDTVNNRITPGVAGYYLIIGNLTWSGGFAAAERLSAAIYMNGTAIATNQGNAGGTTYQTNHVSTVIYMDSNDYVELYGRAGTAGNTADIDAGAPNTYLIVHRMS